MWFESLHICIIYMNIYMNIYVYIFVRVNVHIFVIGDAIVIHLWISTQLDRKSFVNIRPWSLLIDATVNYPAAHCILRGCVKIMSGWIFFYLRHWCDKQVYTLWEVCIWQVAPGLQKQLVCFEKSEKVLNFIIFNCKNPVYVYIFV